MSQAIADLRNEHEAILSALNILEKMAADAETGAPVEPKDIQSFIGFLKEFADKCHHGKEEGLLFPAMIGAGVPDRGGPIGVMMSEHDTGRHFIHEMEDAIAPAFDPARFAKAARGYIALLRAHIQKENMVLFPMAEKVLSEPVLANLYEGFEAHEENVIGHGRHEELHAMLHELQEKYPVD
jgi:hemerythrin-like domain-containing protein